MPIWEKLILGNTYPVTTKNHPSSIWKEWCTWHQHFVHWGIILFWDIHDKVSEIIKCAGLLEQIIETTRLAGVPLAGENALQRYDRYAFDRIAESAFCQNAHNLDQLTFLRMGDLMYASCLHRLYYLFILLKTMIYVFLYKSSVIKFHSLSEHRKLCFDKDSTPHSNPHLVQQHLMLQPNQFRKKGSVPVHQCQRA